MGPDDVRLRQLARILGRPTPEPVSLDDAHALADAIFEEAANSDDVTGAESAAAYLTARIASFGNLFPPAVASKISARFTERWDSWERV